MERYTKGGAFKERCNGNIPYAEIISFVSQVEDLMEEMGFESLEQIKKCFEVWNIEDDNWFVEDTDNMKLFSYRFAKNLYRFEKEENELLKKALKLACEEMIEDLHFDSEDDRRYTLQANIEYFKTMARKNRRGE